VDQLYSSGYWRLQRAIADEQQAWGSAVGALTAKHQQQLQELRRQHAGSREEN
jgi:hypothetical protein